MLKAPKSIAPAPSAPEEPAAPPPEVPGTKLTPWDAFKASLDESLDALCDFIIAGGHHAAFCKERGFSYTSTLRWISADPTRAEMYAREDHSDVLADEIVSISDESANDTYVDAEGNMHTNHEVVARSKLRVDARK